MSFGDLEPGLVEQRALCAAIGPGPLLDMCRVRLDDGTYVLRWEPVQDSAARLGHTRLAQSAVGAEVGQHRIAAGHDVAGAAEAARPVDCVIARP